MNGILGYVSIPSLSPGVVRYNDG